MSINRIHISGECEYDEAELAGAYYPGTLCYIASTGKITEHTTEGGALGDENLFLLEAALRGKAPTDQMTSGDMAQYLIGRPGVVVNALIASGGDIEIGDKLVSAGDGTLIDSGSVGSGVTAARIVAVAMEDVDLTASGASDTLGKVRLV
jgi:hypothetical protein